MNTAQQTVETKPADVTVAPGRAKRFNYYPLLGLAVTIVCGALVYGAAYYFIK